MTEAKQIEADNMPVEDTDGFCMDNLPENDKSGPKHGSDKKDVVHEHNSIEIYYELDDHDEHEDSDPDLAKRSDPENIDKGDAQCTNKNYIDLTNKIHPELANKSDPNLNNKRDPDNTKISDLNFTNRSDPDRASKSDSNPKVEQNKDKNDADRASRDADKKSKDGFDKRNENRLREGSKWRIVQKASHSEKSQPPKRGYDLDAHFDLRSIPIRINQYDTGFDKQLKLPTIIGAFKTASEKPENLSSMTKAEQEDLKFKRQEQFLKAYTTVYDLESGEMVNYHDMQAQRKMSHTQNCYALSNMKPKRKRMCIIS